MLVFDTMINPSKGKVHHSAIQKGGMYLTLKQPLEGPNAAKLISSFHDARDSLLSTVLTLVENDDSEYDELYQMAITGRYLVDVCRNEVYTTRGVKQGFEQNNIAADGDGFNYYSHVVNLYTVHMCFFCVDRGNRRVAVLDQRTLCQQSDALPPDIRQSGPRDGDDSAPHRWDDTYSPYLKIECFGRGLNDRSILGHQERGIVNLTHVDDNYLKLLRPRIRSMSASIYSI